MRNWYIGTVHQAARRDQTVCRAVFAVANPVQPPPSLFHPHIMMRVIKEGLLGEAQRDAARPTKPVFSEAPESHPTGCGPQAE